MDTEGEWGSTLLFVSAVCVICAAFTLSVLLFWG